MAMAVATAAVALSLFEFVRNDGVVSKPQRFIGYTVAYTAISVAIASLYRLEQIMIMKWVFTPAIFGMLSGWAIAFLTHFAQGTALFSIVAMVLLPVIVVAIVVSTPYSLLQRLVRWVPVLINYLAAMGFWIVLWTSAMGNPSTNDTATASILSTIGYFVVEVIWILTTIVSVYFINMGRPVKLTHATDAVRTNLRGDLEQGPEALRADPGSRRLVNLDPTSPHYAPPSAPPRMLPGAVNGRWQVPNASTAAAVATRVHNNGHITRTQGYHPALPTHFNFKTGLLVPPGNRGLTALQHVINTQQQHNH